MDVDAFKKMLGEEHDLEMEGIDEETIDLIHEMADKIEDAMFKTFRAADARSSLREHRRESKDAWRELAQGVIQFAIKP